MVYYPMIHHKLVIYRTSFHGISISIGDMSIFQINAIVNSVGDVPIFISIVNGIINQLSYQTEALPCRKFSGNSWTSADFVVNRQEDWNIWCIGFHAFIVAFIQFSKKDRTFAQLFELSTGFQAAKKPEFDQRGWEFHHHIDEAEISWFDHQ